eukprot:15539807-Heterocapsa_arctica.AAC.1
MAWRRPPTVPQRQRLSQKQGPEATRTSSCWSTRSCDLRSGLSTGPDVGPGDRRIGWGLAQPELLEDVPGPVKSNGLSRWAPCPVCVWASEPPGRRAVMRITDSPRSA